MAEDKSILWIGAIILAVILWKYATPFIIFGPSSQGFLQMTGPPSHGTWDEPESVRNARAYGNPVFQVGSSVFRFEVAADTNCGYYYCGGCGSNPASCYCNRWSCCESVHVYKDDVLVDTITQGYDGGGYPGYVNPNTNYTSATYYSGNASIMINTMTSSAYYAASCNSVSNELVLGFPADSFDIEIPQPKVRYDLNEPINLEIKVLNNIGNTTGNLILDYEVPTIIGTMTKHTTQEVTLNPGMNTFTVSIPSDKATEVMSVTPKVELNYLTTNMQYVNYNGKDVRSSPSISLGTMIGNMTQIMIVPEGKEGYYRFENNTCKPVVILPSLKGDNDYLESSDCSSHITVTPQNNTSTNQTQYLNQTVYQNVTTEKTVYVQESPSIWDRWGLASFVAIILGVVIVWLVVRGKR